MAANLSAFWRTHRRERQLAFLAQGDPKHIAKKKAHNDACNRAFLESLVGRDAALDAQFFAQFRDDGILSIFAKIDHSKVPPEMKARADAWANMPHNVVQ